jgi:hypothetical protein
MLKRYVIAALMAFVASSIGIAQQRPAPPGNLKIVVIAGEGAVNIIQQKTAVAPIVEIRDRNNLPVSGATVTFSVGGSGATFGTGSTLTVVTNAAGQATAAGLTPTAAGALQVNVSAAFQGQLASAAITQTNFATAQAAAAVVVPRQAALLAPAVAVGSEPPRWSLPAQPWQAARWRRHKRTSSAAIRPSSRSGAGYSRPRRSERTPSLRAAVFAVRMAHR